MLVYGDHHFTAPLQTLRAALARQTTRLCAQPSSLERLRTLLIVCGQVEQGLHDALAQSVPPAEAAPVIARCHQATAQAAVAFYAAAWRQCPGLPPPATDAAAALGELRQTLAELASAPDLALTVKVPEGFSIYALYPEQYLLAAADWLAERDPRRAQGAVVVGIRSIGTTLAAVVSTVLRAAGWQVESLTVRPTGHPFARRVELNGRHFDPAALGLIVDEGPGLSGSSMAATARALVDAGLSRGNLAFLPGHANDPGGAGAPEVQSWWQSTPRYVASPDRVTLAGLPRQDAPAAALREPVVQTEDLSGGLWRQVVYADQQVWPPVCTAFERIKYRHTLPSGRQVLSKFLGLASKSPDLTTTAEIAAGVLRARAAQGLAPAVLSVAHGFVATAWVVGEPLQSAACSPATVDTIGAYIARVAGDVLPQTEAQSAAATLAEMLYVNTREALGDEAAAVAQRLRPASETARAYGDGRMQPHEWIRRADRRLLKPDSVGHDCDHTLIGRQAVAWDLAGAAVEWRLDVPATTRLLKAYTAAGGAPVDAATLRFYQAAYLAFRLGQCTLAAQVHDPAERDRLLAAAAGYQAELAALLGRAGWLRSGSLAVRQETARLDG